LASFRKTTLLLLLVVSVVGFSWLARDRIYLNTLIPVVLLAGFVLFSLWRWCSVTTRQVLVLAFLFRLTLVWLPPSLSDDAYRYVWDGLVQVEGISPYRYRPDDPRMRFLQEEPVYGKLNSTGYYTVYPPLSQGVFAVGGLFYGRGWLWTYYVIKVVLVLFEAGAVLILARLVEARMLMLYAWNPLVLLETAGQAHTESILLFFLVLTVYLVRQDRGGWASVALACAGWVKLYPFVLFPFLWRRFRWKAGWPALLVIAVLAAPYAAPYVIPNVRSSLDLYARLFEFNAGLYYSIKQVFFLATGDDWSKQIGPAMRMLFLMGLPVLYVLDARYRWPIERVFIVTLGFFMVTATTVHPWYLLSLLLLALLLRTPAWHWLWLGLLSTGTYLLYVEGPYWPFVVTGWGGWLVLVLVRHCSGILEGIQRRRARRKVRFIQPFIPRLKKPLNVLDLGAGEGYVGQVLQQVCSARVTLVDVAPMNRTELQHQIYDGRHLPFGDDTFDVSLLYFVLHHAHDPEAVLREARRTAGNRVLVVESVYEASWDLRLLTFLDRFANRWRSGGLMKAQEEHLHFRTAAAWRAFFEGEGVEILAEQRRGRWIHKQALFVLAPSHGKNPA